MKSTIFRIIRILGTIFSFFNVLLFYALRPCWSGISSTLGYKGEGNLILYYLPLLICILLFLILLSDLIVKKFIDKPLVHIIYLSVGVAFFIVNMVIIKLGALDYMRFVWPYFFSGVFYLAILCLIYFMVFIYPTTPLKDNSIFKYGVLVLSSLIVVLVLLNFSINRITVKPVVYAVENNYQIVYSSNSESLAWVEVGDNSYYDTYAGSTKKFSKIHKVEVPMSALDSVKKYTVHTKRTIYGGPFGAFLGKDITLTVNFYPVDSSDGIQYLSFSDIHMNDVNTIKTASTVDKYDFLILAGDAISVVQTFDDANFINKVASEITHGEKPVVYARGNHDVKGRYAEELHKFTGAKGESFYYNFYFDDVYGISLDIGEDHDDDWWEFYGTAHYDEYRNKQVDFLKEEIEKKNYDNYKYHLVVCHIPITFVNKRKNHEELKKELTGLLNQMDIDMLICGHQHDIMIFEPGLVEPYVNLTYNSKYIENKTYKGYYTDFNFPAFMVSKPGFTSSDEPGLSHAKSQIGLYTDVDLVNNVEVCYYINSNGEKVDVMNMFAEKTYGTTITIDLNTKVFTSK